MERQAAPAKLVEQEGLRFGLQGVWMSLRPRTYQEKSGLDATGHLSLWRLPNRGGKQEKEAQKSQQPEADSVHSGHQPKCVSSQPADDED